MYSRGDGLPPNNEQITVNEKHEEIIICTNFEKTTPRRLTWTTCQEAMGVEVFETAHWVDLNLQRNPQKDVYKIALIGTP